MSGGLPLIRRLRHMLAGGALHRTRWSEHELMFDKALMIVRAYYVIMLYLLYNQARSYTDLSGTIEGMELMWPVLWLEWTGLELGGQILTYLCLAAGLLGALAWRHWPVRLLVSVVWLFTMAHWSSQGALHHSRHEWFWISVSFLFLPSGRPDALRASRRGRMQFLIAFSAAPALILLFYTLSGCYKVYYATLALLAGQLGGFHPEAMANTLAWRAMSTGASPLWAEMIINTPWLGWPLYLGLYFVEVVSIAVFFRPALHKLWGAILIMFHFGTILFMDIPFPLHVLINGMLFLMSPFAPQRARWQQIAVAIPVFGIVARHLLGGIEGSDSAPERLTSQ